jgi:hypothetical protein
MKVTKTLNNPNAFPIALKDNSNPFHRDASGMSLRDYFAAKAMQGVMSTYSDETELEHIALESIHIAEMSYAIADAMLKQREL